LLLGAAFIREEGVEMTCGVPIDDLADKGPDRMRIGGEGEVLHRRGELDPWTRVQAETPSDRDEVEERAPLFGTAEVLLSVEGGVEEGGGGASFALSCVQVVEERDLLRRTHIVVLTEVPLRIKKGMGGATFVGTTHEKVEEWGKFLTDDVVVLLQVPRGVEEGVWVYRPPRTPQQVVHEWRGVEGVLLSIRPLCKVVVVVK
jgi:hypothetical protein